MVTISSTLASAFAVTAAIGLAATAHADAPLLNGKYAGGDGLAVWDISTSCGASGCTGKVASNKGWTSPTTLTDGRWNFTVTKPDGVICADGHFERAVVSLSVDPVTLGGVISADSNYGCPGGMLSQTPFQLTKVG